MNVPTTYLYRLICFTVTLHGLVILTDLTVSGNNPPSESMCAATTCHRHVIALGSAISFCHHVHGLLISHSSSPNKQKHRCQDKEKEPAWKPCGDNQSRRKKMAPNYSQQSIYFLCNFQAIMCNLHLSGRNAGIFNHTDLFWKFLFWEERKKNVILKFWESFHSKSI